MQMFKCLECGHLFEEGEQKKWKEERGEYNGTLCFEELSGCPACQGAFEKATACKICGGYERMGEEEQYCDYCKAEILRQAKKIIFENFTKEERNCLTELLQI